MLLLQNPRVPQARLIVKHIKVLIVSVISATVYSFRLISQNVQQEAFGWTSTSLALDYLPDPRVVAGYQWLTVPGGHGRTDTRHAVPPCHGNGLPEKDCCSSGPSKPCKSPGPRVDRQRCAASRPFLVCLDNILFYTLDGWHRGLQLVRFWSGPDAHKHDVLHGRCLHGLCR